MPKFEVFIPAGAGGFNVTLKVDADNWVAALKGGLTKLGEQGAQPANLLVDIQEDNTIHVTDPNSGRVFRIREMEDVAQAAPIPMQVAVPPPPPAPADTLPPGHPAFDAGASPTPKEVEAVAPPAPAPKPTAPPKSAAPRPPPPKAAAPPAPAPVAAAPASSPQAALAERPRPISEARMIEQVDRPSQPVTGTIGRTKTALNMEDVLSDLFERTQQVFDLGQDVGKAMDFLLDLVLEKVPAESGSVFVSDFAQSDLELKAVRGPKAAELKKMKLRMPVGLGIVGFCAQEAVSLAISDTQKDPRFYRNVTEKIGYEAKSLVCAPMVKEGRAWGCIEIINKRGSSHFSDSDLAVLAYVAHQGAKYFEQL